MRPLPSLLISLALLAAIMHGLQGNWSSQWLLAVILCQPLSGWLANVANRGDSGE